MQNAEFRIEFRMRNAECEIQNPKRKQRSHRNGGTPAGDFDVERDQVGAFRVRIEFRIPNSILNSEF